jgi:hypothetical protein
MAFAYLPTPKTSVDHAAFGTWLELAAVTPPKSDAEFLSHSGDLHDDWSGLSVPIPLHLLNQRLLI